MILRSFILGLCLAGALGLYAWAQKKCGAQPCPSVAPRECPTVAAALPTKPVEAPPLSSVSSLSSTVPIPAAPTSAPPLLDGDRSLASKMKLAAVEKVLTLTEDERLRLADAFEESQGMGAADTLTEVLGDERASTFRKEIQSSFRRAEEEDQEKDVLLASRQLGFTLEEESKYREAVRAVDETLKSRPELSTARTMQARIREMVSRIQERSQMLSNRLQSELPQQKYEQFLAYQAQSSQADLLLWHEIPREESPAEQQQTSSAQ